MVQTTLAAQVREKTGKGIARRLRAQNLIPAVLYGPATEKPLTISVDPKALRDAIKTPHRFNTILTLDVAGQSRTALLKDYQQDPVSREVLHADFYEVLLDRPVTVPVPLELTGKAVGTLEGGILQQNRRVLEVSCLPREIPVKIEVDVTELKIAHAMHVSEVKPPPGVSIRYATDFTIAVIALPEKEEVVVPTAAVAAAGAAAPAAAAPAAGGKAGAAPAAAAGKAPAAAAAKAPAKK